jgi:hypothetical protein
MAVATPPIVGGSQVRFVDSPHSPSAPTPTPKQLPTREPQRQSHTLVRPAIFNSMKTLSVTFGPSAPADEPWPLAPLASTSSPSSSSSSTIFLPFAFFSAAAGCEHPMANEPQTSSAAVRLDTVFAWATRRTGKVKRLVVHLVSFHRRFVGVCVRGSCKYMSACGLVTRARLSSWKCACWHKLHTYALES